MYDENYFFEGSQESFFSHHLCHLCSVGDLCLLYTTVEFNFYCLKEGKGESINFCFDLACGEMKDDNSEAQSTNMYILITGLDVCHVFELKGNVTE